MKIRKGDTVIIRAGKERGKKVKVLRVLPKEEQVILEGANLHKKHMRARKEGQKGQIIDKPAAMDASNVGIFCGSCNKAVRIGYRVDGSSKVRVCKKCGKDV